MSGGGGGYGGSGSTLLRLSASSKSGHVNPAGTKQLHDHVQHDQHQNHDKQNSQDRAERLGNWDERQQLLYRPPNHSEDDDQDYQSD
jgi:hypothetical protein